MYFLSSKKLMYFWSSVGGLASPHIYRRVTNMGLKDECPHMLLRRRLCCIVTTHASCLVKDYKTMTLNIFIKKEVEE